MMRLRKCIPDLRGQIGKDGEDWDMWVVGDVTCDGTHSTLYDLIENVKRITADLAREFEGSVISKPGFHEEYHKADMAYGKNVDVVTFYYGLCVRLPEVMT